MSLINNQVILIPVYEPTEKFIDFVRVLASYFETIVVVNDGCGKKYLDIFEEISECKGVIVLNHNINQGKGRALKTGINYCLCNNINVCAGIITVDADGQHQIEDILKVSKKLVENPDRLVMGCRTFDDKEIPFRSRFGNKISYIVYKWLCGINVSDTQTGLRGIPASFLKECCVIKGERYEYETNMLLRAKDCLDFVEVPIKTIYENNNEASHFNPWKDSLRIYSLIVKYSLSSLLSVVIDYTIFVGLTKLGIGIMVSTYMARLCSAIVNFGVNRNVVFKYKGNLIIQMLKYVMLVCISGTISGMGIAFIKSIFSVELVWVKFIVEFILFFMNYYVQRAFVFAKKVD